MSTSTTLTSLLPPTAFLLAYSLPLLFASLCLIFAGTFLTLDRTRSFPRAYDAITPGSFDKAPRRRAKDLYMLGGGVGGLVSGWCFGVHFTTFLALLIPATTSSAPLNSSSFLAVWLISTILTTILGGRWRYSAITLSGLTGGCLFSLLLSVLLHPALTTRLVLTAVFTPLILLLCLLPFPTIQYPILRLANASTGAVGLVISIALLAHEPNWANVWERYWVSDGELWGTGKEKGLGAAACILVALGITTDFFLKRRFGECPDQRWDAYLSKYSANLPDRPGTFTPARGFMDKLMGGKGDEKRDIIFPDDTDTKRSFLGAPPAYDMQDLERSPVPRAQPGFLKKARSQASSQRFASRSNRKREAIKFKPLGDSELSTDDDSDDDATKAPTSPTSAYPKRPWLKTKTSVASTASTLVNESIDLDKDLEALKKAKKGFGDKEIPEYSDGEDIADTTTIGGSQTPRKTSGGSSGGKSAVPSEEWSPKFMQQRRSSQGGSSTSSASAPRSSTGFKPVPATPSLIRAIDRVQAAQREAYSQPNLLSTPDGLPRVSEEEADVGESVPTIKAEPLKEEAKPHGGWTSFWRDVERKNHASRDTPLKSPPVSPTKPHYHHHSSTTNAHS